MIKKKPLSDAIKTAYYNNPPVNPQPQRGGLLVMSTNVVVQRFLAIKLLIIKY